MAWYVESLILDRERIRASFTSRLTIDLEDLDDSKFNDLLIVEKTIVKLYDDAKIDAIDVKVLQTLSNGDSLVAMAQQEGTNASTLVKYFFTTCNKISYELQGHFTDAGYIKYMSIEYNLTNKQINKMVRYMQKSRRTRIRRLINDKATY